LAKHVDLDDPEAVKEFIANKRGESSHKDGFVKPTTIT